MTRYGTMDIGSIDIAALLTELIEIMSANELAMPAQLVAALQHRDWELYPNA